MASFAIKPVTLREVQSYLDRAVDFCFLAILFLAPLLMGGRHPVGRLGYVVLISLALVLWTIRQAIDPRPKLRKSGAEWLVLLGLAIPIVQLVHLPQSWLVKIAPNLPHLLPMWFSGDSHSNLGSWSQLSLCPDATRGALVMYLAYAMLFMLVVQRIKSLEDIERLLRWIALTTVSLAILGIAQMLLSNGKFLWVYEHPSRHTLRTVKGPFANANHFAHFLALGIGPLIWWLWRNMHSRPFAKPGHRKERSRPQSHGQSRSRPSISRRGSGSSFSSSGNRPRHGWQSNLQMLLWLALPIVAVAGLLTFSRGGVIILAIAATFVVTSYMATKLFGRRSLLVLPGLGAIVVTALFIYGLDRLSGELESVTAGSIDQIDNNASRRKLWAADWEAYRDFALLGTGAATHREVYPTYFQDDRPVEFTHAESGYIQILMESGTVGICALIMAIGVIFLWGRRCLRKSSDKRVRAITLAILTGILVSVVHSIWDFVWFIPACITLTLVLVACLCRLSQLCQASQAVADRSASKALDHGAVHDNDLSSAVIEPASFAATRPNRTTTKRKVRIRLPWVIAASVAALGSSQMVKCLVPAARAAPYWERYASLVFTIKDQGNPDDSQASILKAIPDLETACKIDPNNARFHLKLAALYLHQFDIDQQSAPNPMTLDQIRQTVADSQFASIEQQNQWLAAAVGENQVLWLKAHKFVSQAARLSPLQGEAYVHLSRLEFLQAGDLDSSNTLMTQALRVRPHDGGVLLAAALDAFYRGSMTTAMEYLRRVFRQGADHRKRVIELIAGNMSSAEFLIEFEPDLDGLRQLFDYYRRSERRQDAEAISGPYIRQLESKATSESGLAAARIWYEVYKAYDFLNDKSAMLTSLRRATELVPDNFAFRKTYAIKLASFGSGEAAIRELRWCLRRKPDDPDLKRIMQEANRKKLRESEVAQPLDDGEIWRR